MDDVQDTIRIVINIHTKYPAFNDIWESKEAQEVAIKTAIEVAVQAGLLTPNSEPIPLLLAKERHRTRLWLAFDLFNTTYDVKTAHIEGKNDFPVILVSLSAKSRAYKAAILHQQMVNHSIRELHENEGWDCKIPLSRDYENGNVPTYWNPRSLINTQS